MSIICLLCVNPIIASSGCARLLSVYWMTNRDVLSIYWMANRHVLSIYWMMNRDVFSLRHVSYIARHVLANVGEPQDC